MNCMKFPKYVQNGTTIRRPEMGQKFPKIWKNEVTANPDGA